MGEIFERLKEANNVFPNRMLKELEARYPTVESLLAAPKEDLCRVWGVSTKRYREIQEILSREPEKHVFEQRQDVLGRLVEYTDSDGHKYRARCLELDRIREKADLAVFVAPGQHTIRRKIPFEEKGVPNSWRIGVSA